CKSLIFVFISKSTTVKLSNTKPSLTPQSPSHTILARLGFVLYKSSIRCLSTSSSHSLTLNVVVMDKVLLRLVSLSKNSLLRKCPSCHGLNEIVICLKKSSLGKLPLIDSITVSIASTLSSSYASSNHTHDKIPTSTVMDVIFNGLSKPLNNIF